MGGPYCTVKLGHEDYLISKASYVEGNLLRPTMPMNQITRFGGGELIGGRFRQWWWRFGRSKLNYRRQRWPVVDVKWSGRHRYHALAFVQSRTAHPHALDIYS
ncbi:Peroxidase [Forsythia ovata]|uniref:Peroxidase n=1 Tax=Forsythia ovata TaxID=205694 RepID=A0ABD1WE42_9LAMI